MKPSFQIRTALAQTIVDAAKQVIGKDINLIRTDGLIIASTDTSRLGNVHEAGLRAMQLGRIIEVNEQHSFIGTQKGINYPIVIDGQTLGAIGLTGDPEECRSLGFLLTKITEILIKEQMIAREFHSVDDLRCAVTRMLIFEGATLNLEMKQHLQRLNAAWEEPVFVLLLHLGCFSQEGEFTSPVREMLQKLHVWLYASLFPDQYVAIANAASYSSLVQSLADEFHAISGELRIGIGKIGSWEELPSSYQNAKSALKSAFSQGQLICEYERLDLEILLEHVEPDAKTNYVRRLLHQLTEEEITLLKAYYTHNLSLKDTAKELYVHKNTLQYRLDKITEKTGLNPRNFRDSMKTYLALLLQSQ